MRAGAAVVAGVAVAGRPIGCIYQSTTFIWSLRPMATPLSTSAVLLDLEDLLDPTFTDAAPALTAADLAAADLGDEHHDAGSAELEDLPAT
jgi:hypothetical protein